MPLPSGAIRAARGGVRNEAAGFDDVFVKPLGRRNQSKMDKLKSAYGTNPRKIQHPNASRRPSTASSRPGTASGRPATSSSNRRPGTSSDSNSGAVGRAQRAAMLAAVDRSTPPPKPSDLDVLQNFNVTTADVAGVLGTEQPEINTLAHTMKSEADQHATMMKILGNRAFQLRAAKALRAEGFDTVLQYLVKMDDLSLAVDVLPVITASLEAENNEQAISLPCCVEMMPLLRRLVDAPYEDYHMVVFSFLNVALDTFRAELRAATQGAKGNGLAVSISSQGFAVGLIGMSAQIKRMSSSKTSSSKVTSAARKLHDKIDRL